ncbi:MAG TPA: iron export ABC transporter permease subunit FetB [Anaeromyxobacteraceae bacterium]|nr:iron export ABC transporter permease subunit FetB [Anaeromyxobacteraceae bacterium]
MLRTWIRNPDLLVLAQAAVAAAAALAVVLLARRRRIHLEGDASIALVRGLVQISLVGSVLAVVMRGPRWTSVLLLGGMMLAAAVTSTQRAKRIPGAFRASLAGIVVGSGTVILVMALTGVISTDLGTLVPVGSMLIANAMNSNGLALNRFRGEVQAHVGEIDTALALGAAPEQTVSRYVQSSYEASLIPAIDNLRSLGLVWIPGLMAGMVLSGSPPVSAAVYQFVVLAMILSSSALSCLVSTTLIRKSAFSPAEQLVLRQ